MADKRTDERVTTLHPDPAKQGVRISKNKYDQVTLAILFAIRHNPSITFRELTAEVDKKLAGTFDGSIGWYVTTVKLDLEARGVVRRLPGSGPQRLTLAAG
jgi:hypothetical protein